MRRWSAIREGRYKFIHCEIDPPQLFDLESDPLELTNLAADPAHAASAWLLSRTRCAARWDMAAFDAAVRESQARRWVVYPALRNGAYYPWDFQPLQKASERYMRNHMDLNVLEERSAFREANDDNPCPLPRSSQAGLCRHLQGDAGHAAAGIGGAWPARPARRASSSSRNRCNGPARSRCAAPIGG